jgi:hypothetical protein
LTRGASTKCRQCANESNKLKHPEDLIGQVFGKWTVIDYVGSENGSHIKYLCKCSCGGIYKVEKKYLLNGKSTQCRQCAQNKFVEHTIDRLVRGEVCYYKSKRGKFSSTKMNNYIHYDSSYEEKALIAFESDSRISSFERCKDRVPYINPVNGTSHKYIPDFVINDTEVIEVKPSYLLDDEVVQAKAKAAEQYYSERNMSYEIWTEKRLNI